MSTFLDFFKISPLSVKVEFFNPDLEKDSPQFIDSYYLTWANDDYSKRALQTQKIFMEELMLALKNEDNDKAFQLCSHFSEPKFTGIGVSKNSVNGRGSKDIKVERIISCLKASEAAKTGNLEDLEDLILVTEGIGADTISDITTNICLKHFAEYTKDQCLKLGIPLEETSQYFYYFCDSTRKWKKSKFELPHAPWGINKCYGPVVLLPSQILDSIISYSHNYLFTNIATPIYKDEALTKFPLASFIYSVKSTGERRVKAKQLREQHPEYRGNKKNMDKLIVSNPRLLKEYREKVARKRYLKRKGKKED